jgi:hypothetical protein
MHARTAVTLLVDISPSGEPVYEQVTAEALPDGRFRLLASPGLALGTAAGDVIEVADDGTPLVVERGGNLALQVFAPDVVADALGLLLRPLGGRLDGRIPDTLSVFTLPGDTGFAKIEHLLDAVVARHPDVEWLYGNVFDVDGVTPLGWWSEDVAGSPRRR